MNKKSLKAPITYTLLAAAVLSLTACSSVGYRCPLNSSEEADSPTACASMKQALLGARKGTGGKNSVLLDDDGRIVPPEMLENKPARAYGGADEPYAPPSGHPSFEPPKVFQVWASSFVDAQGNLHDGHSAWFSTPGRWKYGTLNPTGAAAEAVMRPASPDEIPKYKIVPPKGEASKTIVKTPSAQKSGSNDKDAKDSKQGLKTLSVVAESAARPKADNPFPVYRDGESPPPAKPSAPAGGPPSQVGVTAPSISLTE